ncbi:MAG: helix-turn-helix domain-containing protein [Nitriliruptoraceae bacterium]
MTTTVNTRSAPSPATVHRALASPVRGRIIDTLVDSSPCDIQELAAAMGLHPNTIRSHLVILEEAALVDYTHAAPAGRGRPRRLYRAMAARWTEDGAFGYELLASILAGVVASESSDPSRPTEQRAAEWGRRLVQEHRITPGPPASTARALDHVTVMLDRLGFEPEVDLAAHGGPTLRLYQCPFRTVARDNPRVACAVHLGLTRGALEALGGGLQIRRFEPHLGAGPCVTMFGTRRSAPSNGVAGEAR